MKALAECLKDDYIVLPLDFQKIENNDFSSGIIFSRVFVWYLLRTVKKKCPILGLDEQILNEMETVSKEDHFSLSRLFGFLSDLCGTAEKPVVMIIDEVDSASNNQVFLDFLAQLRSYYLDRDISSTFQSVILAGVHDVKNIKIKMRPDSEHKGNSPWNIASDFLIEMSFSAKDIQGMLSQYEADHQTGMNMAQMAKDIYEYTSGYPFLVSKICKLLDERVAGSEQFPQLTDAWTKSGFLEAVRTLLSEKNTLFESLMGKLYDYPELKQTVYHILFGGERIAYNPDEQWIDVAIMYGFAKNDRGNLCIANRIFEVRLYNYFLAT